jgi:hypothetical protein
MADAMLSKSEKATVKRPTTSKMESKGKGKGIDIVEKFILFIVLYVIAIIVHFKHFTFDVFHVKFLSMYEK